MARLILHIGMQKTGSSAIQSSLAKSTGKGFIYPILGGGRFKPPKHTEALVQLFSSNSDAIAEQFERAGKADAMIRDPLRAMQDKQQIRQAAADAGEGTVILSSEGASSYLTRDDLQALRHFAQELFENVCVVAYIREPFEFVSANFQTQVRGRRLAEFKLQYKPLRPRFEMWDEVFGKEHVHLWKYDRSIFPKGDVVEDFCARLGLPPLSSTEKNVTLSRASVAALFRLNRAAQNHSEDLLPLKQARGAIIRDFPHRNWPKFRLSPKIVKPLLKSRQPDIDWLEQRVGCSLTTEQQPRITDVESERDLLTVDASALAIFEQLGESLPAKAKWLLRRALEH